MSKQLTILVLAVLATTSGVGAQHLDLWVTHQGECNAMPTETFNPYERNFLNDFNFDSCDCAWSDRSPHIDTCDAAVTEVFFVWGRFTDLMDYQRITELQLSVRVERADDACMSGLEGTIVNSVVYRHERTGPPGPYDRWDNPFPIMLHPEPGDIATATTADGITNMPFGSARDLYCVNERIFLIGAVEVFVPRGFEGHLDLGIEPNGIAMTYPPYPDLVVWDDETSYPPNPPGATVWSEVAIFDISEDEPGACCFAWGDCAMLTEPECEALCGEFRCPCMPCEVAGCPTEGPGACCFDDGTCEILSQNGCSVCGGLFQGVGTTCDPNPCQQPGACCQVYGQCDVLSESDCNTVGGLWLGEEIPCDPEPCDLAWPVGACCFAGETCHQLREWICNDQGGTYQGDWVGCSLADCPYPTLGACCLPYGSCSLVLEESCIQVGGQYLGDGVYCSEDPCPDVFEYTWTLRSDLPYSPPARYYHAAAGSSSQGLRMYGGQYVNPNPPHDEVYFDDTYRYTSTEGWTVLSPAHNPGPRYQHDMAFLDGYGFYLFGGLDPTQSPHAACGDLWLLTDDWTLITETDPYGATAPQPCDNPALACDTSRDVLMLFGGNVVGTNNRATWEWDGTQWTLLDENGPDIAQADMAYDQARDKMVLVGAYFDAIPRKGTWEWDGDDWVQVADYLADEWTDSRIAYHGCGLGPPDAVVMALHDDLPLSTARWDGSDWTAVTSGDPGHHHFHSLTHMPAQETYLVLFGGYGDWQNPLNETWEMGYLYTEPEILLQPTGTHVCEGSRVSLTTLGDCTPDILYRWQYFENDEWHDFPPPWNATMTRSYWGMSTYPPPYRCRVKREYGEGVYTDAIDISMIPEPDILEGPMDQYVCEGEIASFSVVAEGGESLHYQWAHSDDLYFRTWTLFPGAVEDTFDLVTEADHDGLYIGCLVANKCASTVARAELSVDRPPSGYLHPSSAERQVGSSLIISSIDSGTLPMSFQWYYNGELLEDGPRINGSTTDELQIIQLHLSDAGDYTLRISNTCDEIVLGPTTLTVTGEDCNNNGILDSTEQDSDDDTVIDDCDNCPLSWNPEQDDSDEDGLGDECDPCPYRKSGDVNGDGTYDHNDLLPYVNVLLDPGSATEDDYCAADMDRSGYPNGKDTPLFIDGLLGE